MRIETRRAADIVWNIWLVGGIVLAVTTGRWLMLFLMMAGGIVMGVVMILEYEKGEKQK